VRARARILALLVLPVLMAAPALAQPFDPAQVEAGMAVYKPAIANCEPCHGYGGNGALALDEYGGKGTSPGPPLLTSKMTRAEMIDAVACGFRNDYLTMPQYLPKAWTPERPCWGKVRADLTPDENPMLAQRPLTEAQIEAVVTFVQAFYQGSTMNRAKCLQYWGDRSPACNVFTQ
jgi:hypothetical protein